MLRAGRARTHQRRTGRKGAAGLTAIALVATSFSLAAPSAAADGSDLRVPLPQTISTPQVAAASGDLTVLDLGTGALPNLVVAAPDGTTTPLDVPWLADGGITDSRGGTLVAAEPGFDDTGDYTDVFLTDLAGGTTAEPVRLPGSGFEAADPQTAVYSDTGGYHARELGSATTHDLEYTAPTSGDPYVQVGLAGQDVALFTALGYTASGRPAEGALDVVPLSGDAPTLGRVAVTGLMDAILRDGQVVYVTATSTNLSLCFRSTADATAWAAPPACIDSKAPGSADQRDAWTTIHAGAGWLYWSLSSGTGTTDYLVEGTDSPEALVPVKADDATTLYPAGDATHLLATVGEGADGYVGTVGANGMITEQYGYPGVSTTVDVLELTPDRVTGLDERPEAGGSDLQAWQRTVFPSAIGEEERPFPRALDVGTSGARTLLDDGSKLRLYDRGNLVRTLAKSKYGSLPGLISGPYYPAYTLSYVQALRVDGKELRKATIRGLFGSLILMRTNASLGRYDVYDLVTKEYTRVNVPVKYRLQGFSLGGLWGDWAFGYTFDSNFVPYTLAINYRTDQVYERYGLPVDYGDSFVAIQYYDDNDDLALEVWNPATQATESIPDLDWGAVVSDGTARLAYSTATELVVRTLDVAPASPPRLLGVIAPASVNLITSTRSWKPEFDTTKALDAGTVTISNAAGEVVRTFDLDASEDGSIRDVVWDGTDEAGLDVATGTYTWQLVVPAADGSGNVTRVDGGSDFGDPAEGTDGVQGSIAVIKAYLGTVSGSTPKVSDSTPTVGQTLTANTGTWSPTDVATSCQWRRTTGAGTAAIDGATECRYKVDPADVGAKLSVAVTGVADGWRTTTKTSSLTSTVKKASFTQKPTPVIDDTTPTVGDVLTATPGKWEPAPVGLTYKWYKVKKKKTKLVSPASADPTYQVQAGDVGYQLRVKVTGTKDGYNTASRYSKLTAKVPRP